MRSRSVASPRPRGHAFGAVLLDLDGTLIDSNDAHARAWSKALRHFGHRVSPARVRREVGKGGQELFREFAGSTERHFLGSALGALELELFLRSGRARCARFREPRRPCARCAGAAWPW